MANLANYEIDGASYSYDSEAKNSLGTSMIKKIINNETAEIYAAGNQTLKEVNFFVLGHEVPSYIKIKYTGELNYSNLWLYTVATGNCLCLADKTKIVGDYHDYDTGTDYDKILPTTKSNNYKIISVEIGGSYEGFSENVLVDMSNYELKTLECYYSTCNPEKRELKYYGNLAKSDLYNYYMDSEGSKSITSVDTNENFFIKISETEIA